MKRKKLFLLINVLVISILLILTNYYTIKVVSAIRAYTNGESEFSKGQKDASLFLATYVQTGNPEYWLSFKQAIKIPIGDNLARTCLTNKGNDQLAIDGFLMGKNHPNDIPDMIWIFKTFHNVSFMKKAISIWADTEPVINDLAATGEKLHDAIEEKKITDSTKLSSIQAISIISARLSIKQSAFSEVLGNAARDLNRYLLLANVIAILIMLGLFTRSTLGMINSISGFEMKLKSKINELNDTNRELEHFTHIASHDLQEPLRMISSFLGLLQKKYEGKLDEQAQKYIHFAVDGAGRMKTLILDLLEYSKTTGKGVVYKSVDLNLVIDEMKIIFQEQLQEKGSGIFNISLPVIMANQMQMQQLFQNLIGNALKYRSESPPQINIRVTSDATHWTFCFEDNGQGIEAKNFDKIFEIFKRLHSNTTHAGTGIGLATCKKIVERHGGTIWIKSEPGKGSNFFFTISKQL